MAKLPTSQTPTTKTKGGPPRRRWRSILLAFALLTAASWLVWNNQIKSIEMVSWKTEAGEIDEIQLADGSKVWLNENSKLSYEKMFRGPMRSVSLEGEAFFEVVKDPKVFKVSTPESTVEVLGTSFNVNAYGKVETVVTVKTGEVRFTGKKNGKTTVLKPKEEGVFNHTYQIINIRRGVPLNALAWQNKTLDFADTPLPEVFKILERYFKVKIEAAESTLQNCRFTLKIENPELDKIWSYLTKLYQIKVEQKSPQRYLLSGGSC